MPTIRNPHSVREENDGRTSLASLATTEPAPGRAHPLSRWATGVVVVATILGAMWADAHPAQAHPAQSARVKGGPAPAHALPAHAWDAMHLGAGARYLPYDCPAGEMATDLGVYRSNGAPMFAAQTPTSTGWVWADSYGSEVTWSRRSGYFRNHTGHTVIVAVWCGR
jgi:hypothetical protein